MTREKIPRGTRRYVYQAAWMRIAAYLFDSIGALLIVLFTLGRGWQPDKNIETQPKKILVIRLDHIGDILFARPSLHALRKLYPAAQISVLTSSAGAQLLAQEPGIDELLTWDAPWFDRSTPARQQPGFWELAKQLHAQQFDLGLDLRGDFRHALLLAAARVRKRIGYGITGGGFLFHQVLSLRIGVHEVERDLDVIRALGALPAPEDFTPLVLTLAEQEQAAKKWQTPGKHVVIHPGAGDPQKCWSWEIFSQVCTRLTARGCEVVLVGSAPERSIAEQVAAPCPQAVRVLAGETSLRELIALIGSAELVIGHDSGPAHLAVTQGIPVIFLWSETNEPEEWGPWGEKAAAEVIRHPWRPEVVNETVTAARRWLNL